MKENYTVYMHITPSNKRYVGITCRKPKYRWNYGKAYKDNRHFFNAIQKYGWDGIKHILMGQNLSKDTACVLEQELIKKYDTTNPLKGYNHSIGGESGSLGVCFTEERKRKISIANKGKRHTDDAKKRMSEGHLGKQTWNKGRPWNDSEKETFCIAQKRRKSIKCIETGVTYNSIRDAARKTGINRCSIRDCCNKRKNHKSAGGYHWKYADEKISC